MTTTNETPKQAKVDKALRKTQRATQAALERIQAMCAPYADKNAVQGQQDANAGQNEENIPGSKPFDLERVRDSVRAAHAATRAWVADAIRRPMDGRLLLLSGRSGCGKTHMLNNARAVLKCRGVECQRWHWVKVVDMVARGDSSVLHHLSALRVLLLDDVGAENMSTAFRAGQSAAILCELLDARAGKYTLITTNLTLENLADVDSRLASRMLRDGGDVADMRDAQDYALGEFMRRKGGQS